MSKRKDEREFTELLAEERIVVKDIKAQRKVSDEELNLRYVRGEIRIVTESARYSLAGILSMLNETIEGEPRYKLDPEYQRRHRWSNQRKSRLIESFLMNVPVPPVFLYERELARFEVMDGRQRLTALSEFYSNAFALEGLQYWSDLDGRYYQNLPKKIRDGIDRRYISSIILLKETASDEAQATMLKKMVFERLNSGGVELAPQETRNAVYDGPLNRLCLKLSENNHFKSMWGIPNQATESDVEDDSALEADEADESTKIGRRMFEKMEDVELILRFFAYRQIDTFKAGLNKITEYLDSFLLQGNGFPETVLNAYSKLFNTSIEFLWSALGPQAFTLLGHSKRPTKIIYDPIMHVASTPKVQAAYEDLISKKDVLISELTETYLKHKDLFSGRRTNYSDTLSRNDRLREAFERAISKSSK